MPFSFHVSGFSGRFDSVACNRRKLARNTNSYTQMEGAALPRLPDGALAAEAQIHPEAPAPFRRVPLDPDDPTAQIMGEIQAARRTPMEPGSRSRRRERSLPRLPQNNLKGFDIPTYELQPMFGTDKRAVPYW